MKKKNLEDGDYLDNHHNISNKLDQGDGTAFRRNGGYNEDYVQIVKPILTMCYQFRSSIHC